MKTLSLASFALILSAVPGAAWAANDSAASAGAPIAAMAQASAAAPGMAPPPMPMPRPMPPMGGGRNWGGQHQGRWIGGWRAPGGWGAYRRPMVGYVLPRYWINPSFYVSNYGMYGFSRPAMGYGWSRYYDDAVLTDRYGRVTDSVYGYNWGQYDRYDDGGQGYGPGPGYGPAERPRDRDGGLGGAVIGGAIGALGGSAIAGRGDRAEGAIIGGVAGAVAGAVIDRGDNAGRGYGNGYGRPEGMSRHEWKRWRKAHARGGYGYPNSGPGYGYGQQGGGYGYQGYGGGGGCGVQQAGGAGGPDDGSHWSQNGQANGGQIIVSGGGWGYTCVTTITIHQPAPVTTTTTSVTERVVYQRVAARHRIVYRKPVRHYRPRCQCRTAAPVLQGS